VSSEIKVESMLKKWSMLLVALLSWCNGLPLDGGSAFHAKEGDKVTLTVLVVKFDLNRNLLLVG
jgi:hypothetical protein